MATRDALLTTMVLLLAAVSVAAAAMAPMDIGDDLLVDLQLQQDPCPQVEPWRTWCALPCRRRSAGTSS